MPNTAKEQREHFDAARTAYESADVIVKRAAAEGRPLTEDESAEFDRWSQAGDESLETAKRMKASRDRLGEVRDLIAADNGDPDIVADDGRIDADEYDARYGAAWERYIRDGMHYLTSEERDVLVRASRIRRSSDFAFSGRTKDERDEFRRNPQAFYQDVFGLSDELRAQAIGTDSAGGYLVPEGFSAEIVSRLVRYGGMRGVSRVFSTPDGRPLPIPTNDDTSNVGELLGENTEAAEQDFTYGEIVLGAFKYSTKLVKVSREMLQDEGAGALEDIQMKMAQRLGRIENQHFTTGTGTAQPRGIVTAATSGVTAASATAITYNETLDLKHSVDPDYRAGAGFMLNDSTWLLLKKLADGDGRPLWSPPITEDAPARWDGDPVTVNQQMPAATTGNKSMLYGDFSHYRIRDVRGLVILRLDERFATADQVGFVGFMRADGDLIDSYAVRALTQA